MGGLNILEFGFGRLGRKEGKARRSATLAGLWCFGPGGRSLGDGHSCYCGANTRSQNFEIRWDGKGKRDRVFWRQRSCSACNSGNSTVRVGLTQTRYRNNLF